MSEAILQMSATSLIIVQKYQGVFKDFTARRAGIVRALTTDVDRFYGICDPEKENLCLYGLPDESWEVSLPVEEVPPLLPEPVRGINFARDGMTKRDWIFLVAVHSDCWLLSVALYLGARLHPNDRKRLLCLIYDLPTVFEVVSEGKPMEGSKPSVESGSESGGSIKGDALCGTCGVRDRTGEFLWYDGKCVKAKTVEQYKYKCPSCKLQESKQAVV